ncbi:hypothetical protein [Nonomuraea sp. NPDC003201]
MLRVGDRRAAQRRHAHLTLVRDRQDADHADHAGQDVPQDVQDVPAQSSPSPFDLGLWRDEVEMTALCLRISQASLVMVNVLMLYDVLADPRCSGLLTPVDRRGLTPLFWLHVRPPG